MNDDKRHEKAEGFLKEGVSYFSQGNIKEAIKSYQEGIDVWEGLFPIEAEHRSTLAYIYLKLGLCIYKTDTLDLERVVKIYLKGIEVLKDTVPLDIKYKLTLATLYLNVGNCFNGEGKTLKAIQNYLKGIEIWDGIYPSDANYRHILAALYLNLGVCFNKQENLKSRNESYEKGIAVWEGLSPIESHHRHILAHLYCNLGICFKNQGDLEGAIQNYHRGIAIWDGLSPIDAEHCEILTQLYCNLGICFKNQGKFEEEIESYCRGIEVWKGVIPSNDNHRNILSEAHVFLGAGLIQKRDSKGAIETYKNGIAIWKDLFPEQARHRNTLALLYCVLGICLSKSEGDLVGAIETYQKGIRVWKGMMVPLDANFRWALACLYFSLGVCLSKQQDQVGAIENYRKGIEVWEGITLSKMFHRNDLAKLYFNLGVCLSKQQDQVGAIENYRKGIEVWEGITPVEAEHRNTIAELYCMLGVNINLQKDLNGGIEFFQNGIEVWEGIIPTEANHRNTLAKLYLLMGGFLREQQDLEGAIEALHQGINVWENLIPIDPNHKDYLATLYFALGCFVENLEGKIDNYLRGIRIWKGTVPLDRDHRKYLAKLYFNLGTCFARQQNIGKRNENYILALALHEITTPIHPELFTIACTVCSDFVRDEINLELFPNQHPILDLWLNGRESLIITPTFCQSEVQKWLIEIERDERSELPFINAFGKNWPKDSIQSLLLEDFQGLLKNFLKRTGDNKSLLELVQTLEEIPEVPLQRLDIHFLSEELFQQIYDIAEKSRENSQELVQRSITLLRRILDRAYDEDDPISFLSFKPLLDLIKKFYCLLSPPQKPQEECFLPFFVEWCSRLSIAIYEVSMSIAVYQKKLSDSKSWFKSLLTILNPLKILKAILELLKLKRKSLPEDKLRVDFSMVEPENYPSGNRWYLKNLDVWHEEFRKLENKFDSIPWFIDDEKEKELLKEIYPFFEFMFSHLHCFLQVPFMSPKSKRKLYDLSCRLLDMLKEHELRSKPVPWRYKAFPYIFGEKETRTSDRPSIKEIQKALTENEVFVHLAYTDNHVYWFIIPKIRAPYWIEYYFDPKDHRLTLNYSETSIEDTQNIVLQEITNILGIGEMLSYVEQDEEVKLIISPYGQTNQILFGTLSGKNGKPLATDFPISIVPSASFFVKSRLVQKGKKKEQPSNFKIGLLDRYGFNKKKIIDLAKPYLPKGEKVNYENFIKLDQQNFPQGLSDCNLVVTIGHSLHNAFKLYDSSLFKFNEFIDIGSFALKLKESQDDISRYLRDQFSSDTRELLDQYTRIRKTNSIFYKIKIKLLGRYDDLSIQFEKLKKALIEELNSILLEENFYKFFKEKAEMFLAKEPAKLHKLREKRLKIEDIIYFNRLILERFYPDDISTKQLYVRGEESKTFNAQHEEDAQTLPKWDSIDYYLQKYLTRIYQPPSGHGMEAQKEPSSNNYLLYEAHKLLDEAYLNIKTWIALNCWSGYSCPYLGFRWEIRSIWFALLLKHIKFYIAPIYPISYGDASYLGEEIMKQASHIQLSNDPAGVLQKVYAEMYKESGDSLPLTSLFPLQVFGC